MTTKTDGGPAFPTVESIDSDCVIRRGTGVHDINGQNGMTLRDWFAGMASLGILYGGSGLKPEANNIKGLTELCYQWSDAMLIAREK